MATLRDIKARITGVKNTQQITKAMKMVSAARLRRAQENIIKARPYFRKISEVLDNLLSIEKNIDNPLFVEKPVDKIAVIIVTSDRGLCGAFNTNVIRRTEALLDEEYKEQLNNDNVTLYCVGKKCSDYFSKRNYNIAEKHIGIFSNLKFEFAAKLVNDLTMKFLNGEYDKVILVYNQFKSVMQQNLTVEQLLPLHPNEQKVDEEAEIQTEFIYEPDKPSIIDILVPKHLKAQMWRALLESYAAELGARMTAMDMATENASELIRSLKLTYNKERQAAITNEILEIVSGANALKSN
ncbi:MAG: ATP synthase F1 subunit gamma [Ignavibacteriae bacterium]|nr:ATP synthase F1 subunit gamma [Ignavibacteriota bacterium]NOG96641.1 ATP synthase F1 subunit gamma [Ignavibacteriota bacterium]